MNSTSGVGELERSETPLWIYGAAFKLRAILMVPPLVYTFVHYSPRFEKSIAAWISGLAVFALGFALRLVSQRHLFYRLSGAPALATTGPYRFVRNPVYLGNMLILGGLALMSELPWMAPLLVAWSGVVYAFSVRFEEARLHKRFGREYEAYLARTPRWVPHFSIPRAMPIDRISTWKQAFGAEWHCFLLILFPLAKELLEHRVIGGMP